MKTVVVKDGDVLSVIAEVRTNDETTWSYAQTYRVVADYVGPTVALVPLYARPTVVAYDVVAKVIVSS